MQHLIEIDRFWFYLINHSGNENWDEFMLFATHKLSWIPLYALLVAIIIYTKKKKSVWILLTTIIVISCCDLGSVQLFKNVFERLRPCHALENVRLVTEGCGGYYGFVSSHASNVFGLAIVLGKLSENRMLFLTLLLWASVVSFSRVYVGVHYPSDILGGMMWGTFVALIGVKTYTFFTQK